MLRNRGATLLLGFSLAVWTTPLLAHHSRTMFAEDKTVTLEGTMKEMAFSNPHSLFFVDARPLDQPDAPVANWSVEGPRPRELTEMGWQPDTIRPGDKVRITGHPRRDGKPQILFIEISDEKGHHFVEKQGGGD